MALSPAEIRANQSQLDIIQAELNTSTVSEAAAAKLSTIMASIQQALNQHSILLSLPEGIELLKQLMKEASEKEDYFNRLTTELNNWAAQYQRLSQQASDALYALHVTSQSPGIIQSLKTQPAKAASVLGDANDLKLLLNEVTTDLSEVRESGTYILPAQLITAGSKASEEETKAPHIFLQNALQEVIAKSKGKTMTVVVPLNSGQSHWQLFAAEIHDGKITHAGLRDSLDNPELDTLPAYKNVVTAVTNLTPRVKVKAVATGMQVQPFTCMDYVVHAALHIAYPVKAANSKLPENLKPIRDAKDEESLRQAIIDVAATKLGVKDKVTVLFAADKLTEQQDQLLSSKLIADKEFQVSFDKTMATFLARRYALAPTEPEESLVQQARALAAREAQLRRKLSFFPPVDKRTRANLERQDTSRGAKRMRGAAEE